MKNLERKKTFSFFHVCISFSVSNSESLQRERVSDENKSKGFFVLERRVKGNARKRKVQKKEVFVLRNFVTGIQP